MKITKEELLQEMEVLLEDEFVADIKREQDKIVLKFLDGQSFCVRIEEV